MPADSKNPTYEAESKVDMAELREAVHKVFDYQPSQRSVTPKPKHRKPKQETGPSKASQSDSAAS